MWNQIEAALAYGRDLPLLLVSEHGLREDGLLEGRYDWKVFWTDFSASELASEKFAAYVASWKRLVDEEAVVRAKLLTPVENDLSKMSLTKLVGMLTLPELVGVLGTLASMLAAVAAGAFKLGAGQWPWA